jgi:hypothetical protein
MGTDADIFGGKFWGMNHSFKTGFIVENERYYQFENHQPTSQFFTQLSQNQTDRIGVLLTTFSVPAISTARATGTTVGMYGSDEMKPANNLTIKVGFRLDREAINSQGIAPIDPDAESAELIRRTAPPPLGQNLPVSQEFLKVFTAYEDLPGFVNQLVTLGISPDLIGTYLRGIALQSTLWQHVRRPGDINLVNNNFAPNLSISWDPWNDAKTKFALTYGKYYNNIPLRIPALELGGANATIQVDTSVGGGCPAPPAPCPAWEIPGNLNEALRQTGINPAVNVYVVDRNLKTPHTTEQSFKFERELTAETAFRLTYVRRHKQDDIQDIDINHAPGDFGSCLLQTAPGGPTVAQLPRTPSNPTGGDGVLDDCIGRKIFVPVTNGGEGDEGNGNNQNALDRPDGIPDAYVLNPAWGAVLLVGNFNSSHYDGVTLELDGACTRGWQLNGSLHLVQEHRTGGGSRRSSATIARDRGRGGFLAFDQTHSVNQHDDRALGHPARQDHQLAVRLPLLAPGATRLDAVPPTCLDLGVPNAPRGAAICDPPAQRPAQRALLDLQRAHRQGDEPQGSKNLRALRRRLQSAQQRLQPSTTRPTGSRSPSTTSAVATIGMKFAF